VSKPEAAVIALALAKAGVAVFPVKMPDKRPLVLWGDEATTDKARVAQWWLTEFPGAAIGMHTGKSGLVVVDLDIDKGNGAGRDNLDAAGITLPDTLRYKTPSGGRHHVYAAPEGKALTIAQGVPVPGVDIRAGVGFAIYYGGLPGDDFRAGLAAAPEWALVPARSKAAKAGKPSKAERAEVEAWLKAQRKGEPTRAAVKSAKRIKRRGTDHDVLLEVVADLVKRGTGGERGIRPLLVKSRARYVADFPEYARHYDNALAGSVRHHGMPPATVKAPKVKRPKVAATEGAAVLDEVRAQLERFVAFPSDEAAVTATLWAAHTHLIARFDHTPRLAVLSPEPGSGKTRALELLGRLVANPLETVNVSAAYLARRTADGDVTILYDEVDALFGTRARDAAAEELRGILNSGHKRGAVYSRASVRGKEVVLEDFPTFAPVAMAGLGELPDTIMTRSATIKMRRRAPHETVEPYRDRVNGAELARTHDRLAAWARSVRKTIGDPWPAIPEGIADRDADVWEPLLAVAEAAGGHWPETARATAVVMVTDARDRPATLGIRLLADARRIIGERKRISVTDLLGELIAIDDAPWGDLGGRGAIDGRYLGKTFSGYGIPLAHTLRFDPSAGGTRRGWDARDFADAWSRYLPPTPGSSVTTI
jgi:hypothetical protein